jgi:Ima1 N-terminal domain
VEETSSPLPLARPFARPLPNDQNWSDTAIFCSTCLKNQHLLTQTLANYLPSLDHPNYTQYEASYPEFRQKLEERYPPVCPRCEPGASRQIQQAGYVAKSDHLRRMMEHSRARKIASRWGWRSLVVTLGAALFCMSIVGQLSWNLIGLLEDPNQGGGETGTSMSLRRTQCAAQAFATCRTDSRCAAAFAPVALLALIAGLLASWWNPRWQHKLQGREGRLVGLGEYYQVNTAVLLARFGFFVYMRNFSTVPSTEVQQRVSHALASVMTIVFTFYTLSRVKIDTTPLVSWQNSPLQLLSQRQFNHPKDSGIAQSPLSSDGSRSQGSRAQKFPISSLAPEPTRRVWQSPTPPSDEDPDAMEWEPSQNFQPNPLLPKTKSAPRHSPFHGTLPAKPTNRLLHPQPRRQSPQKEAVGLPPGFFDQRDRLKSVSDPASLPPMAQPKFFSQGDRDADTGLEALFNTVFSLGEAHAIPAQKNEQKMSTKKDQQGQDVFGLPQSVSEKPCSTFDLNVLHAAKLTILAICLLMLYAARGPAPDVIDIKVLTLCIAGSLQLSSAILESRRSNARGDVSDIGWAGVMAAVAAFLSFRHWSHGGDDDANQQYDATTMIYLFLCSCWELPRLFYWNLSKQSNKMPSSFAQEETLHQTQYHGYAAVGADDDQPSGLSYTQEIWKPSSSKASSPLSQDSRRQPKQLSPFKAAHSVQAPRDQPIYRPRSDSTDSMTSKSSTTTTATTTTAGWRTPALRAENFAENSGQSPSFNIRSLALDDAVSTPRRRDPNGFGIRNRRRI